MAKPTKRNRKPITKLDYSSISDGIYIDEVSFGEIHKLELRVAEASNVDEYVYEGKLHKGEIKFVTGEKLATVIPTYTGFNHGFTLEGEAKYIFEVENALDVYSNNESRTFNYTKVDSKLIFKGDSRKTYAIYVRFYENCLGNNNNRWAVIYAEEK